MKRLIAILGSLVAGAAVGLLFAPTSGKETREKIKQLISEKMPNLSKERLEQLVDEVLQKITNVSADTEVSEGPSQEQPTEAEAEEK